MTVVYIVVKISIVYVHLSRISTQPYLMKATADELGSPSATCSSFAQEVELVVKLPPDLSRALYRGDETECLFHILQ